MLPISVPVNEAAVTDKVVAEVNPGSVDFSQLVIVPVYPDKVRVAGAVL
jgi:hypothetical protein